MALPHQQIQSQDVIPRSQVQDVHPETRRERLLRTTKELVPVATAAIVVLIGFLMLCDVILWDHPALEKHRDEAWTVLMTLIAAASGFMFGRVSS